MQNKNSSTTTQALKSQIQTLQSVETKPNGQINQNRGSNSNIGFNLKNKKVRIEQDREAKKIDFQ